MRSPNPEKMLGVLFLAIFLSTVLASVTGDETVSGVFVADSDSIDVELEIADTPEEREKGMMYRQKLENNKGMIFVYGEEEDRSFWMKNTYIPLDIIFLDSNRTVINIEQADPQLNTPDENLRSYRSEEPAQYVVELNQGFAENNSIGPGDKLLLERNLVK